VRSILALIFFYPALHAATITGGSIDLTSIGKFHFQGIAAVPFDLEGVFSPPGNFCGNCPTGQIIVFRTGASGGDIYDGPGTVDGIYYPRLFYDGTRLFAETAPFLLTTATTYTVPFTLTGTLGVYLSHMGPGSDCIVCDPGQLNQEFAPVTGMVTIQTTLYDFGEEGSVHVLKEAVFVINEVPEPSPASLLIAGLSLVVLGRLAPRMSRG